MRAKKCWLLYECEVKKTLENVFRNRFDSLLNAYAFLYF